ncbi:hypothetical protein BaRGS_00037265, partial [Batillaria attramentaria]
RDKPFVKSDCCTDTAPCFNDTEREFRARDVEDPTPGTLLEVEWCSFRAAQIACHNFCTTNFYDRAALSGHTPGRAISKLLTLCTADALRLRLQKEGKLMQSTPCALSALDARVTRAQRQRAIISEAPAGPKPGDARGRTTAINGDSLARETH